MTYKKGQIAQAYNTLASRLHQHWAAQNFFNTYLDTPAVMRLLPNVRDLTVLDLGCGSGRYAKLFQAQGATVYGIDVSEQLIDIARREVAGVSFDVADMEHIPFADHFFDIVVSPLAMHYLEDWTGVLQEVKRVLKPAGCFIFSTTHPLLECWEVIDVNGTVLKVIGKTQSGTAIGDYFTERWIDYVWGGVSVPFHHKTFETIIHTIVAGGFVVEEYVDAQPAAAAEAIDPEAYGLYTKLPLFCAMRVRKGAVG